MEFQNIINKYHYEGWLSDFLAQVYEELVIYFGEENRPIIYEALLNTEVVLADNVFECLVQRRFYDPDDMEGIVTENDLKRASGVYYPTPILSFDGTNYKLEGVKRLVVASIHTEKYEDSMKASIIHEIGHLVKSYYNEYRIDGNILYSRSGLMENVYEMSYQDGNVKTKLIKEKGVGIEEGLNAQLEETITRKIVNPEYKISGYGVINAIIKMVTEEFNLLPDILEVQMHGGKEKLIEAWDTKLKENSYLELEELLERIYALTLKAFGEIFQPEKSKVTWNEISQLLENNWKPYFLAIKESQDLRKDK